MTILDLVRIIRSNIKILLITLLAGALLAAGYTLTRPVQYTASSSAQVMAGASNDANAAMVNQQLANQRSASYAQLVSGSGVSDRIVELSHGALKPGDFSVAATSGEGTSNLGLTAVAGTASKAQLAANLIAPALSQEIKHVETLNGAKSTVYDAYQLSKAGRPAAPSSPNWTFNILAGSLLGLIGGLCLVVLRKQLDSRIRHTNEVEKITGTGVLGVIPKAKALQTQNRGGIGSLGTTSEAFRMLRTNLRYVSAEQPPRSLVITSAVQGEGKSTVAANLARVLAAAGQRVVLVDTDLRRPVVHDTFDLDNTVGLTEVLTGQARLMDVIQRGDHKNLSIITAGRIPPNPSELLGSRRMSGVIDALSDEYFVVLDAPPLLPVTDGGLLSVAADGAAVVYHHSKTHREQIALCTKILEQVGANYFGSILNMTPTKEMGSTIYGYGAGNYGEIGYGYGYGYGHVDEAAEAHALTPAAQVSDLTLEPRRDDEPVAAPSPVSTQISAPGQMDTARQQPAVHQASGSISDATTSFEHASDVTSPLRTASDDTVGGGATAAPTHEQGLGSRFQENVGSQGDEQNAPPSRRTRRRLGRDDS